MNAGNAADVLLVEDNPHDANLTIRAVKKSNPECRLLHVEDGAAAIDYLFCRGEFAARTNGCPKVVLLDLKLPRLGGFEVLKEMRGQAGTRTTPVVMVTSSSEDPDIRAAYSLGANSYVVKPMSYEQFQKAMVDVCRYWLQVNELPR